MSVEARNVVRGLRAPGTWTEDDYFALPEMIAKGRLVDGVLVVMPAGRR